MSYKYCLINARYPEDFEAKLNTKGSEGWRVVNFTSGDSYYDALLEQSFPDAPPPTTGVTGTVSDGIPENIRRGPILAIECCICGKELFRGAQGDWFHKHSNLAKCDGGGWGTPCRSHS